jgi:CubicO group peptidase (beta-lactamase class C family)
MRFLKILFIIIIFILISSCRYSGEPEFSYQYIPPPQIDDGWETASLSLVGLNPEPIRHMMDYLNRENEHKIHSILIVKDNKLVLEEYLKGYLYNDNPPGSNGAYIQYDRDVLHFLASVTKSITSVLFGIALSRNYIHSIDDKLSDYFPEYSDIFQGEKANITLRHLLTMTSGLDWDESTYPYGDRRNDVTRLFYSPDPMRFILEKPLVSPPGSAFVYKGGDTNLLGGIIRRASEYSLANFAERYLFGPLDIEEYSWDLLAMGELFASGGLYMRPRDLVKIGYLFLNEGFWQGQHMVD